MLKLASLLLAFFLVAHPVVAQAESLTLNRIKALLVEAGFKDSHVSDDIVVVDDLGRFGTQIAVGLAEDKSTIMLSTNWSIPAEKQGSIPALEMLAANSYSPFVFSLVSEDSGVSLNIEATYDSALVSKAMLRKAVEQIVETIDENETLWNTDKWADKGGMANPDAAKPEPAAPAGPKPTAPAPSAKSDAPGAVALTLPKLLFVTHEAKDTSDVAARPTNAFAQGEKIMVYLEAAGLTVSPAPNGQNQVVIVVDAELRNWSQQVVGNSNRLIDTSLTFPGAQQPPVFMNSDFSFKDQPPGAYILTFKVLDKTSGRTTQADLPFSIVAGPTAAAPSANAPVAVAPVAPPIDTAPKVEKPRRAAAPAAKPTITAQGSDGLVAQGMRAAIKNDIYAAPRIEVRGTSMTADELARILDPEAPASVWDRILGITAREIAIPELRIETAENADDVIVLRDVRFVDVAQGRIGSLIVAGVQGPVDDHGAALGFGRLEIGSLDLALLSSLAAPSKETDNAEPKTAYRSISLEGLTFSGGADGTSFRISRIASRDVRIRRVAGGWTELFKKAEPLFDKGSTQQSRVAALNPLAEILESFEPGSLEMTGYELTAGGAEPMSSRVAKIGFTTDRAGPGEIRADGLAIDMPDGKLRLSSFAIEGISLRSAIQGMCELATSGATEISVAAGRRLVPEIRTIRFGGADAEFAKSADGPVGFSVGSVDLEMANPVDGIPTSLRFSIDNYAMPLDSVKKVDVTGQAGLLGYQTLGLTGRLDLGWNEKAQQIELKEISIDGVGMGSIRARGIVANVSKDLFSPDTPVAAVALLGSAIQSVEFELEDKGLLERVIAAQATQSGESPEAVRTGFAAIATLGVTQALGDRPEAKALGQALGRFVAKPSRLFIGVKAKQPPGLGFADFQASPDPTALLDKVEIVAEPR